MAKRNKNKLLPFILMTLTLSAGIFLGALIASPPFREGIFTKVNNSHPVRTVNEYFAEKEIELAFELPVNKEHPALRRKQHR